VDTTTGGDTPCGTVRRLSLDDLAVRPSGHLDNAHDASLPLALDAGRALGADLPGDIAVVAIEASRVDEFGDVLSPPVAAAIGPAVEAVIAALRGDPR
jgi:hydrogenase maturation protease